MTVRNSESGASAMGGRPRIAVFAGPTATILNTPPLVTSGKAAGQDPPTSEHSWGGPEAGYDTLRAQRLGRSVTVYVEQFTAHPLEHAVAGEYAPPDGYIDTSEQIHDTPQDPTDRPVYKVELKPEDGLYLLPFMGRRADGRPWDLPGSGETHRVGPQTFLPDAARLFEEIDRFGLDSQGRNRQLSRQADFDHFRVLPPGGYTSGLPETRRTDVGEGDISPESLGEHFFPYQPAQHRRDPPSGALPQLVSTVQRTLATGRYDGALWLEGSTSIEETAYWLNLLVDTDKPIAAVASQYPHWVVGNTGARNIVDAVAYIVSEVWAGPDDADRLGVVLIQERQLFAAREAEKTDARPGGFIATGGHGGIVGSTGPPGTPTVTYVPTYKHTHRSMVKLTVIPSTVPSAYGNSVAVKDGRGGLDAETVPSVSILKQGHYAERHNHELPIGVASHLEALATRASAGDLAGLVIEGETPFGHTTPSVEPRLQSLVLSGVPVVRVGRGSVGGFTSHQKEALTISGSNLTATKARLLLTACLLRFGAPTAAADPSSPTDAELNKVRDTVHLFQTVFDTH